MADHETPGEQVERKEPVDLPGVGWAQEHIGVELESFSLAIPLRDDIGAHLFPGLHTSAQPTPPAEQENT